MEVPCFLDYGIPEKAHLSNERLPPVSTQVPILQQML